MFYDTLLKIDKLDYRDKRVLLIGGGYIGGEFCKALRAMRIEKATVITLSKETASQRQKEYGYPAFSGGYFNVIPELANPFDLVIVATPVHELKPAAEEAIKAGNKNILVEKPAALYSSSLEDWEREIPEDTRVRIAYNRLVYPSLWKLKEIISKRKEQITSCFYTFTEWTNTINFNNNKPQCYQRWGITNSLHVISMAHSIIDLPDEFFAERTGSLPWHTAGSQFVGAGVTRKNIPFSYHANWASAGRWGVEIMTPSNAYRLIPLEQLFCCSKGTVEWSPLEVGCAYPQCKTGIAEEIAVMLAPELEHFVELVTIKRAILFTRLAEKIFGYSSAHAKLKESTCPA